MNTFDWIRGCVLMVSFGLVEYGLFLFLMYRIKERLKYVNWNLFIILLILLSVTYIFIEHGFHGGWRYCYISDDNHAMAIYGLLAFCLGFLLYFTFNFYLVKRKFTKDLLTDMRLITLQLIVSLIASHIMFWYIYGPMEMHGGIGYADKYTLLSF